MSNENIASVSGSLELLQKERERLYASLNATTPDWKRSKINNQLHKVWLDEELLKN